MNKRILIWLLCAALLLPLVLPVCAQEDGEP